MLHRFRPVRFVLASAVMAVSFVLSVSSAKAFAVSPVLYDYTLDPGASIQGTMRISNDTNQRQTYYTSIQNFVPQGEEGQQEFVQEAVPSGLMTWIGLDRPTVMLDPGESADFGWAVRIPQNAEPGGHYAAVFFSTIPDGAAGSAVGVGAKTGVLFLVNVNGNIREAASIESFTVLDRNRIPATKLNRLPAHFEVRMRNQGSVHLRPEGTITFTNMFGSRVGSSPLNATNGRVLPNSVRRLYSSWGPLDVESSGGFFDELVGEAKGFALGKYTATLEATYGRTSQRATATATFWVIPWRLLLVALLALIGLVALIKGYNRLVVRSAMNRMSKKK